MLEDPEISGFLATTWQKWEDGRTHLAKAIESYVNTTTALREAATSYPLWKAGYPTSMLEDELESLCLGLQRLKKARMMLASTRNVQCSPINRLPSELLAFIFQILVDDAYPLDIYTSTSYVNPAAKVVQVCSRWHQIALDVGHLWSCIVFPYQDRGVSERILTTARIHLERTRGSPIDLFLSLKLSHGTEKFTFRSTYGVINPYLRQLRSLTIRLPRNADIESLLKCCLTNGTPGSLSRLEIIGDYSSSPLFHQVDAQTLAQLNEYLRSVRILKLRAATFDWKCPVFEQLNELVFNDLCTPQCPNLTQLVEVLSASPGLCSLRLKKMTIRDEMGSEIHSPVKLEHLEKLTLDNASDAGSCKAVSVLSLGHQSLDFAFRANLNTSAILMSLRQFASENRIETFRFTGTFNHQPIKEILESLPDLTYLVLDELKLGDSDFDALVRRNHMPPASPSLPHAQAIPSGPLSRLRKMALTKCMILCDEATFKKAIFDLSLDSLRLYGCAIEVKAVSQENSGSVPTALRRIDTTTELGLWLTDNMAGKMIFD